MLRRFGLLLMLVLTGWIPFQSVAAWQAMTRTELNVVQTQYAEPDMAAACHDSMPVAMTDSAMHSQHAQHDVSGLHDMQQHGSQCASCLPLCSGIPPAVSPWREFALQQYSPASADNPLYSDFIPGVLSPPPLTFII